MGRFSTIWRTTALQANPCYSFTKIIRAVYGLVVFSTLGYYDGTAFHDLIPLYLQHYEQSPSPQWTNQCWGITQDKEGPHVVWL